LIFTPIEHGLQDGNQGSALFADLILNAGNVFMIAMPADQAIGLELPKLLGEYLLGNAGNEQAQFTEAYGAVKKLNQDYRFPFISDDFNSPDDVAVFRVVVDGSHVA